LRQGLFGNRGTGPHGQQQHRQQRQRDTEVPAPSQLTVHHSSDVVSDDGSPLSPDDVVGRAESSTLASPVTGNPSPDRVEVSAAVDSSPSAESGATSSDEPSCPGGSGGSASGDCSNSPWHRRGRVSRKHVPSPGLPHTSSRPPCNRASSWEMASPRPVPPVWRFRETSARQKRLNTSSASSG